MKLRKLLALLLVGMMVFALAACGGGDQSGEGSGEGEDVAAGGGKKIDVILKTTASEYWGYVMAGALAYGEENGVTVEVKGPPSETSFDEQQNMIETDLNDDSYDGYVIAPLQGDTVATLIKGQTKPILAVDTKIEAPEILSFVGTGNEEAAKLGAAKAVEYAKEKGWEEVKCIEIAGVQGDATNTARMNGYKAGVNENGGEFLEGETQYADGTADKATTAMEAIMQNHPEGVAIICANNDDMAQAAARAAAGNEAWKNTVFLGFDGTLSACDSILAGEETMSVAQMAYEMGYKAVEACCKAIDGETLEAFIDSGADVVTPENAQARKDLLNKYLGK
ncbi:MAG: sugar ABC transporter substrate-binding protein [Mogibacterium sp.]|nr:sugar ABC transporter substrate-binding protein [Mogibacterium sp.]